MSTVIRAQNIRFGYAKTRILNDVSVEVRQGTITSLLGPNGSGKSTMLRIMLGLLKPDSGDVFVDDIPIRHMRKSLLAKTVAYVPQSSHIIFSYTALEVVLMGRISYQGFFSSSYTEADKAVAIGAMERLGVGDLQERIYSTLSGGQKQLILIARALAQEAKILVMDEPVTGLDYGNQIKLLHVISELAQKDGIGVLQTTHFPEHAVSVSNDVVMLKNGVILAHGATKEVISYESIGNLYDIEKAHIVDFLRQSQFEGE